MKNKKVKKVLVIGSGPIIIGQAAEFDYSGTQACLALREEGIKTILLNSNPATIQTDKTVADVVYLEPMSVSVLEQVIKKERPDGLIATVGGQTALNLTIELEKAGILDKYKVQVLGTSVASIKTGEDRGEFCALMKKIGLPVLPSVSAGTVEIGITFAESIGYPAVFRSMYNLGGTGSGVAWDERELSEKLTDYLDKNLAGQVLVEKSVLGWGEFEYEVIRDSVGNKLVVCVMENMDPMGVHTGESIVVAPMQTISDDDHQKMRSAALRIVDVLDIRGSCNVQFAFDYQTGNYFVIEVNPRLSRSSALASKAAGYPIARVAAKIALGFCLPDIINPITGKTACFEPALDYVVVKIPKWPDDKFIDFDNNIGMTMKSTGETMAIGRSFEEAMYKAINGLELKQDILNPAKQTSLEIIKEKISSPSTKRSALVFESLAGGMQVKAVSQLTGINSWFINKLNNLFKQAEDIKKKILVYKMVDSCAGEFSAITPYFYSTHGVENEAQPLPGPKVVIIGSGPIRIGQGVEFDCLTVHAVQALKKLGIKAIVINNNPETVSTDFSISDRLYFEPLTWEFVSKVLENEKDGLLGVFVQFGGQTAINLAKQINTKGVTILGTSVDAIEWAEDRNTAAIMLNELGLQTPFWCVAKNKVELKKALAKVGFPLLIRPSFVIAGEGMILANKLSELKSYLSQLPNIFSKPFLVDSFLAGAKEVDIDFISDGIKTISFVLEQLEPAGVHSGDSHCVFPTQSISKATLNQLGYLAKLIAKKFKIIGFGNIQCALKNGKIYVLEVNPRASRTVPFLSKALGSPLVQIAVETIITGKLKIPKITHPSLVFIKKPIFSFEKMPGVSKDLGPVMKSTGEMMSSGKSFNEAWQKVNNSNCINIYSS